MIPFIVKSKELKTFITYWIIQHVWTFTRSYVYQSVTIYFPQFNSLFQTQIYTHVKSNGYKNVVEFI